MNAESDTADLQRGSLRKSAGIRREGGEGWKWGEVDGAAVIDLTIPNIASI
jgi:hypothetical protein